ncbi:MAG TPA: FG-GAP-like repeat-containing protein, partial [Terriglobia bacterium]|nr:FG-GAP-like repeat-containing protein [Terriglobia bacterium]
MRRNGSGWLSRGGSLISRRIAPVLAAVLVAFGSLGLLTTEALAQNPVPFVNLPLVPDAVAPGGPNFTLTVNGTGFVSGAVVDWNGGPLATQFVSGAQLTATVLAADIATASTASVTVVNPAPGGGRSNLTFFSVIAPTSAVAFAPPSSPPTGLDSSSIAVGDFNGDGKLDLAVTNYNDNTVSILLGDGAGNFTLASSPAVGKGPEPVVAGDFNGDGKLDLAVANNGDNTLSILLGDGTGNFTLTSSLAVGTNPRWVGVADFNGDGNLDLAVGTAWTVSILLGDGAGNFTPGSSIAIGPNFGVVGDFNGDGIPDLVVNTIDTVFVLLGDGTGNFTQVSSIYFGDLYSVAAGDFNNDGRLDLAVPEFNGGTVSLMLGDGMGHFALASRAATGNYPWPVTAGDFNGDGNLDLVVGNFYDSTVSIFLGDGAGNLTPAPSAGTGGFPWFLAAGDFNGDGRLDLAITNNGGDTLSILLQVPTPGVTLFPPSLSFGAQFVSTTSSQQTVTLTNTGSASLDVTSIATGEDFQQTNTCAGSLVVGASCTISVTFTPSSTGTKTAAISIADSAAGSPQTVSLAGTGIVLGFSTTLSSTSLTFPSQVIQTTSAAQTVTFTNTGTPSLNLTSIVASGDFAQTNTCGNSLASGASCAINVTFTPTQTGTRTGTITIMDNAPGSPQVVNLTGTGVPTPGITLLPSLLDFQGCVGSGNPPSQSLTLTNNFSYDVSISSIAITGYFWTTDFSQTNNCGSSLSAGQSCTITVSYSSTYAIPTYVESAWVTVTTDTTTTAYLSGVFWLCGTTISADPSSLTFAPQVVGTTSGPQTVTLWGELPAPSTISAVASGDFSVSITQPGAFARQYWLSDVTVTFTPTATGNRTGNVTVSAPGYTAPVIPLTGTGIAFPNDQNPVPFISQPLLPDAVAPGGTDFTLTVNGAGFVSGSVVGWNGSALTTQFVNGTQLKATVPTADILTAGTAAITVASPEPGGGISNGVPFFVNVPASTVLFGPASTLSVGAGPNSVAVGDFNGDGLLDLAISNWLDGTVSVFLGDGTGNFTLASSPVTGAGPLAVAVGDFNGDGRLDLAVCDSSTSTVLVLLGDGTGNFTLASSPAVGNSPWSVAAGDFNEDGNLDLAVVNEGSGTVSILLGDGTGNFVAGASPATGTSPMSVAVGDFNGDGKLDLAVANQYDGTVSILLGDGTGNFTLASSPATGQLPSSLAVADFNGDSKLDLAVANNGDNTVSILLGDGTGHFTLASSPAMLGNPTSVAVGDFNGDGNLDLAVTSPGDNTASILLGDGTSKFTLAASTAMGTYPGSVAVGDFNGDGKLDLVAANYYDGTISVLVQAGADITLSSGSLDFANQALATTSARQTVTLKNTGSMPLVISAIDAGGDFVQTNTCGNTVAPGASCTISVTFTPTAINTRTGTIIIYDNAPRGPHVVTLTGTGVGPAVTLSASTLSVGTQTVSTTGAAHTLTLTNSGGGALTITSISVSGDFSETNTCGNSVAAGTSCTINITFTPTAPGTRTGAITITDNAPGSPHVVTLTGTGMGPAVSFSASTMSVGGEIVGNTSAAHTVTLTNSGNDALTITGMTVSPSSFSETNTCKSSLAAGVSCTITVTFTPSVAGKFNGMLSVADNAPGSPHQVTLSGTGQDFAIGPYNLSQTIPAGMTTAYDLKVKPLGEFNQTVSLACSGAPAQSTCSVS